MKTETGLYIVHNGSEVQVYTKDEWLKQQHRVWWLNLKNRLWN